MNKRIISFLFLALFLFLSRAAFATTWFVRADGGTRYSANASSGQCDGQADAPYPGSGTNRHCAFNDYRSLWDDQNTYGVTQWVIAGGDTVILDNTKQWRVGFDQGLSPNDAWCWGGGGPYGCTNPTIPAGTAQNHTRILGRNYASCSAANHQPDPTQMTQIFGGYGLQTPMNLTGAQFVDVQCIELTRHSQCITHGSPAYPSPCSTYFPIDDYDSDGIQTDTRTHDVLLQDMWIHGHTDRGIIGPIGGLVTANRINVDTNGMAGWDLDRGDGTGSPNGALSMSYSTVQWSGCNQEYPAIDPIPVISCYSQSTGGYGDGIGTPITNMVSVAIDHSIFRYNTQDGEDFGHVINASSLSVTDSVSYANNGGQFKWAGFQNVTFANNLAVANCLRLSQPLPGTPSTYNANLADFCRANDAMSFDFNNNATALIANNTLITYAPTTFDIQCYDSGSCANTTLTMNNNLVLGYQNPSTWTMGGQSGGVGGFCGAGCNGSKFPLGTFNRANNLFYGIRGSCIANQVTDALQGSSTGESCADPQLNNEPTSFPSEAVLDGFDFSLSASSPAKTGGTPTPGLTTDYTGATRNAPPSQGALEYLSAASLTNLLTWGSAPTPPPSPTPSPAPSPVPTPTPAPPVKTDPPAPVLPPAPPQPPSAPVAPPAPSVPVSLVPTQIYLSLTQGAGSGGTATLRATVQALSGSNLPTGVVIVLGTDSSVVTIGALDSTGSATWTVPSGLHGKSIYAAYPGNNLFQSSISPVLMPPPVGFPF